MTLSESIIKIHSIAAEAVGELEADEFITSLLVVALNELKKNGELNPDKLEEIFKQRHAAVEETKTHSKAALKKQKARLVLVSNTQLSESV